MVLPPLPKMQIITKTKSVPKICNPAKAAHMAGVVRWQGLLEAQVP
jgi:hypothetical protein